MIDWFSQETLQHTCLGIIGCGAVGNEVVKNLTLLGVGKIDVYDFDEIQIHNLTRSIFFRESDIGRNKAVVLAERLTELDPNIKATAYPGDFWEKMTLDKIQEYDALICCVDNFEARLRLNKLCLLFSKDLINTGIDSRYAAIELYPFSNKQKTACYECNLPPSVYNQISRRYSCGWLRNISFVDKIIPTTTITASLAGAIATSLVLRLNQQADKLSKKIFIDTFSGNSSSYSYEKNPNCPSCSRQFENIIHVKSSPKIEAIVKKIPMIMDEQFILESSDPIITKFRCVMCHPNTKEVTKVFKKASNFDAQLATCTECGNQSVDIEIKDRFSLKELARDFRGYDFPSKFLSFTIKDIKIVINLEN